jgi:adenine-specific DNA-methyltransferase
MKLTTFWSYVDAGSTRRSNVELAELIGRGMFDNPKPTSLLKMILDTSTGPDDLILDFFAGSGTAAHSIMDLNKEDGGSRKFILVQLPEATNEKSEAFKAGYKTISQITIERVKRAGAKIKAEKPEVDTGFKTLRLAKSLFPQNMFEVDSEMSEEEKVKAWEAYLEKSKQAHLFDFKPDELLVEIALKDGFDLNFKAEPMKEFKKNKVLDVSDGEKTALVCLDESIHDETIKTLEAFKERRFICLERSVDSTRKWNLKRMFGDNLWVA